jgi:tetratricopeptide (TPR) repeat protein
MALADDVDPLAAVLKAAERGRLLVFAGAGISMAQPSCLPNWKGFNRALLEEVKKSALTLPALPNDAAAAIRRIDFEKLEVEGFSDTVVSSFAGESYFPILEVLDSEQTNAHHRAIAELARRGACRALVTTNFDQLLERALQEVGVPYDAFVAPDDYRRDPKTECAIYKIHGSVASAMTLVDTVTQKLRGLSFPVRARLADLFQSHHVLVIGFSGADLVFGADYLALSALKGSDGGITWIVEPGRTLNPRAEALVRELRGTAAQFSLADIFSRLGVAPEVAKTKAASSASAQAEADAQAGVKISQWLNNLGNGPLGSVLFCIALADERGWRADATILRAALAVDLERRGGTLPLNAILAFNTLARGAEEAGDYQSMAHWAGRALAMCAEFEHRRKLEREPVSPAGMRDMQKQWIASYVNLGRSYSGSGDIPGAREAFARARPIAEALHDSESLSHIFLNEVLLQRRQASSIDGQIELTRRASSVAARVGAAQTITEGAVLEAHALATIGEYDAALRAVERAERAMPWSGSLLARLSPELMRAEMLARRGRPDEAAAAFDRAIAKASIDPVVEARLRLLAASVLAFHQPYLQRALQNVDCVLRAMAEGRIPREGNQLLGSEAEIRELPAALAEIATTGVPTFLSVPVGVVDAEREARGILLNAEYEGDSTTAAQMLLKLANSRYDAAKPRRMLDLAEAALLAAERSGERRNQMTALFLVTIARDLSGDLKGALAAGRQVMNANPPADDDIRIRASQSVGIILARIGRTDEAEPLLRAAVTYHEKQNAIAEQARSIIALADALASGGDRRGATSVLERGSAVIERTGDRAAIAKRDAMLASFRLRSADPGLAPPMLFTAGEGTASLDRIEQLRQNCESATEQCDVAALALASGHVRVATDLLLDAQASFQQDHDPQGIARCFHLLADAAALGGRWDNAADFTRHALAIEEDVGDVAGQIASYGALAWQFIEVGRGDGAAWAASECLERSSARGRSRFTAIARYALSEAHRRAGHDRQASEERERARAEFSTAPDLPPGSALRRWLESRLAKPHGL